MQIRMLKTAAHPKYGTWRAPHKYSGPPEYLEQLVSAKAAEWVDEAERAVPGDAVETPERSEAKPPEPELEAEPEPEPEPKPRPRKARSRKVAGSKKTGGAKKR